MAFLEDPRLRQRWNQITHDAEAVTENAAAGIWSFQHNYINPCFSSFLNSMEQCTVVCLGDPEERMRKRREREHSRRGAEYSFDFYDDWYEDEQSGGLFSNWGNEDWERLLAGTGSQKKHTAGETSEQPRRKRGMSYGTRGGRRKTSEHDPTIIPSTQPIGFLSKLPWKMGGTLRYKPSAADLQDHPQRHGEGESEPLLGSPNGSDHGELLVTRKRSGTTGSGDTTDSYRSRGDLFPSDGEGEEDAIPLDDEVTYDMVRNDRSSGRSGGSGPTRSKGKWPAGSVSRTVSRTTLGSARSRDSLRVSSRDSLRTSHNTTLFPAVPDMDDAPSLHDLHMEEHRLQQEEDQEVARKKASATQLAVEKGLGGTSPALRSTTEPKPIVAEDEVYTPEPPRHLTAETDEGSNKPAELDDQGKENAPVASSERGSAKKAPENPAFVPARLPSFG